MYIYIIKYKNITRQIKFIQKQYYHKHMYMALLLYELALSSDVFVF